MFTGIFRATTFCFLTVVSLSLWRSWMSSASLPFTAASPPLPLSKMNFLHCSRSREYFRYFGRLQNSPYFCVFKYARAVKQKVGNEAENRERDWGATPNSASPSRNTFRGLVTSSLCDSSTYSTRSAMSVTGIMRLFRSNCPRGVQNTISLELAMLWNTRAL